MRPLLMVAYHYPPEGSSSGVLRTLKFSKYLPRHGWLPHVLTLRESIYPVRDEGLAGDIPANAVVHRTLAFDATRHLTLRGRRLAWLGVPDRVASWLPFGVVRGLRVIRQAGIRALYSTTPVPTAHLIAGALHMVTRLPWVADFRDPWVEEGIYPAPRTVRYRVESALEAFVVRHASRVTVTSEQFRHDVLAHYPDLPHDRVVALFNGYDEEDFTDVGALDQPPRFEILHAGLVAFDYRDPLPLLRALKSCVERGRIDPHDTRVTFLGGGAQLASPTFRNAVDQLRVGGLVEVVDRLPYAATLRRMGQAAVLLLLQASDDTRALIPAKAFEYVRVGRPVLALTFDGAAADFIRDYDAGLVADPRNQAAVESALTTLYDRWRVGALPRHPPSDETRRFERAATTAVLATILDRITNDRDGETRTTMHSRTSATKTLRTPVRLFALVLGVMLSIMVLSAPNALSQEDYSHLPLGYTARNHAIISAQIQFALEREKSALEVLQSAATDRPTLEPAYNMVKEGYVYLRFAQAGLEGLTARERFNPLLKIRADMIGKTRGELITCLGDFDHVLVGDIGELAAVSARLTVIIDMIETLIAVGG